MMKIQHKCQIKIDSYLCLVTDLLHFRNGKYLDAQHHLYNRYQNDIDLKIDYFIAR